MKGRALALLAQREHSAAELRRKLLRHARAAAAAAAQADLCAHDRMDDTDSAASDVDAVIAWLSDHHYLSDTRFVESRVHARSGRYGNLRIRQELSQHGLAVPPEAAQALKDSEPQRALAVWRRKFGSAAVDAAERARQARFLAQRGFSPDVISRVLRELARPRTDTAPNDPDLD